MLISTASAFLLCFSVVICSHTLYILTVLIKYYYDKKTYNYHITFQVYKTKLTCAHILIQNTIQHTQKQIHQLLII